MAKYIDVEPLMNGGWQLQRYNSGDGYVNQEYSFLKDIPPADVRPVVRGKWIEDGLDWLKCSSCGAIWWRPMFTKTRWLYCPNCGSYNGGDISVNE